MLWTEFSAFFCTIRHSILLLIMTYLLCLLGLLMAVLLSVKAQSTMDWRRFSSRLFAIRYVASLFWRIWVWCGCWHLCGSQHSDLFERYGITGGSISVDWRYMGSDYTGCDDLWMSKDGRRIFTQCGNVFRSSSVNAEDRSYNGSLSEVSRILHVFHNTAGDKLHVVVQASSDSGLLNDVAIWSIDTPQ
jgi:hypothetical protein